MVLLAGGLALLAVFPIVEAFEEGFYAQHGRRAGGRREVTLKHEGGLFGVQALERGADARESRLVPGVEQMVLAFVRQ